MTRTGVFTVLRVSRACYDEIAQQLRAVGRLGTEGGERPRLLLGGYAIEAGGYGDARLAKVDGFDVADRVLTFQMEGPVHGLWLGQPARIIMEG